MIGSSSKDVGSRSELDWTKLKFCVCTTYLSCSFLLYALLSDYLTVDTNVDTNWNSISQQSTLSITTCFEHASSTTLVWSLIWLDKPSQPNLASTTSSPLCFVKCYNTLSNMLFSRLPSTSSTLIFSHQM